VYRVEFYPVGRYDCISIVVLDDSSLMFRCQVVYVLSWWMVYVSRVHVFWCFKSIRFYLCRFEVCGVLV